MNEQQLQRIRALIIEDIREIIEPAGYSLQQSMGGGSPDTLDLGALSGLIDENIGVTAIRMEQLGKMYHALEKFEDGTGCMCDSCGKEISLARLEAISYASQCIVCEKKKEYRGNNPKNG